MKDNVLWKTLSALRTDGEHIKLAEIIVGSVICDCLEKNKLLKERLSNSLNEDLLYLIDNNPSFSQLKEHLKDIERTFFQRAPEHFYKKIKKAFVEKDVEAEDQDILEIISNRLISKTEAYDFLTKKKITSAIISWLSNGQKNLNVYCPFSSLLDLETEFSTENNVTIAGNNPTNLLAKKIYSCCNGKKTLSILNLSPTDLGEINRKFDIGFSLPPLNMKIGKAFDTLEIKLIEDLLERISGRFCVITVAGISTSSVKRHIELKKKIINSHKLQAVVELPGGFIPFSGVSCLAWFFDCSRDNSKNIALIDLSSSECKDQKNSGRTLFEFNDYAIKNLTNGLNHQEDTLVKIVSLDEVSKNDFVLTPSRYVLSNEEQESRNKILKGDTKLSDVVEILRTQIIRPLDEGNTYYEVSAADINAMGVIENPSKQILQIEENIASKNLLKKDDIIFAIKGSVGKVGLVTEDHDNWLLNQSFVILRVKNNWPVEFVFRQLKSNDMKIYLQGQTIGSVIPSLAVSELKEIPLVSPTIELINEQRKKHSRQLELTKRLHEITSELEELNSF